MDKFVVKKVKKSNVTFKALMIRTETYELLQQLREMTGMSVVDIMDSTLRFCADRLEVIEEDK